MDTLETLRFYQRLYAEAVNTGNTALRDTYRLVIIVLLTGKEV